jgi:hypothetical protein
MRKSRKIFKRVNGMLFKHTAQVEREFMDGSLGRSGTK